MIGAAKQHELARLRSLYALDLIGHGANDRFEPIARLAALSLGVPVALVTLLDTDHQWFSAAHGTDLDGNVRSESFCTHIIDDDLEMLVVEDTQLDPRFVDLPIVAGEPHIRFYAGVPIRTANGDAVGTLCGLDVVPRSFGPNEERILTDLVDVIERELRHVEIAATDALTGLANRRGFITTAEGFMTMAEAQSALVSVVFGDVDGLKLVNDELGHDQGDTLLQRAAAVLRDVVGPADLAARVGGDEFAIVSYGRSHEEIDAMVARLTDTIAAHNATSPDDIELSISVGQSHTRPGDTLESLLKRADSAMYRDKHHRVASRAAHGEISENPSPD